MQRDNPDTFRFLDKQGAPREIRQDTNDDGKVDSIFHMQNGNIAISKHDEDHDNRMETVCKYEKGIRRKLERDNDGDGQIEHRELYAQDGSCIRMESDRSGDGRIDTQQLFEKGKVSFMETDESGNGRMDLRAWFRSGEKERLERDADGDGRFETLQQYGIGKWTMVLSQDLDGDGNPEARLCYMNGLLREKFFFLPDGEPHFVEYFNERGLLEKSQEREAHGLTLTWFYDEQGKALRAERDKNLNGKPEETFFYRDGNIFKVEEDTNADGQPDIWEEYDAQGELTATAQDMDFDGEPDLVKGQSRRTMAQGNLRKSI